MPPRGREARRVYQALRDRLASGEFTPGSRLPSHIHLARSYGVAVLTVRSALDALEHERTIVRHSRRGTFVLGAEMEVNDDGDHAVGCRGEDVLPLPIFTWRQCNGDWVLKGYNQAGQELTAQGLPWLIGSRAGELFAGYPDVPAALRCSVESGERVDRRLRWSSRTDPGWKNLALSCIPLSSEVVALCVADLTELEVMRGALQQQQRQQTLFDALTGLPNRTLFEDRLQQALLLSARGREPFAVLVVDLDRFAEVNGTLGHDAGDRLLVDVGTRLRAALRNSDTVARLGSDEFVVLLRGADVAGAVRATRKLLSCLDRPMRDGEHSMYLNASVGIAVYPQDGDEPGALLRCADIAVSAAKRTRAAYALYRREDDPYTAERLALIAGLRDAIEDGQLRLHYQPKIDLSTGRLIGVEALVRWQHPERGMIPPVQFVPLAEHTGLIRPLTNWVINEALAQLSSWRSEGLALDTAVNVSTWGLHDAAIVDTVDELLRRWNISPDRFQVEVTESALMLDPVRSQQVLGRLADMGITIAIDDFGTGYSSLGYLDQLPAHQVKIDRVFVRDVVDHQGHARIVRATIDLAHDLGLKVIAEGVEDAGASRLLAALGCDMAQGYHISPPLSAHDLITWVRNFERSRSIPSL